MKFNSLSKKKQRNVQPYSETYINPLTLQTTGRVLNIPGAVYSIDNDRVGHNPVVAFCTEKNVLLVQDTM